MSSRMEKIEEMKSRFNAKLKSELEKVKKERLDPITKLIEKRVKEIHKIDLLKISKDEYNLFLSELDKLLTNLPKIFVKKNESELEKKVSILLKHDSPNFEQTKKALKEAGGKWNNDKKSWDEVPYKKVVELGLESHILK